MRLVTGGVQIASFPRDLEHVIACVEAMRVHCGGDPAKVGQMKSALESLTRLDEREMHVALGEAYDEVLSLARAALSTEPPK